MQLRERIVLFLKGMSMGAADTVPGVSGGTIAFISGIYEELIRSIRAIGPDTLLVLRKRGLLAAWRQVNGGFLLTLLAGIATSILLLVRPITWALKNEPVLLWSFFFGLIAASIWLCGRQVRHWSMGPWTGLLVGTGLAVMIAFLNPAGEAESLWFFFLAGSIAICAMILPGISGSFILLLLGAYAPVMAALKGMDIPVIVVFMAGCLAGLMAFSRLLNWMFTRQHDLTVATLTGFLLGSLVIVWPWKEVLSVRMVHAGKPDEHLAPFVQRNVLPADFGRVTDMDQLLGIGNKDPKLLAAVGLMVAGAALLLWLERFSPDRR
jgi:putative membrane protein